MALKLEVGSLEGIAADLAKEYKKVEVEGKTLYRLDLDGYEDPGALKRAKEHEKESRKLAETKVKELTKAVETAQEELDGIRRGAIPKGDVEKLETSWKEKLAKKETELGGQLESAQKSLKRMLVDNVAQTLATKISTAPELLLPHIRTRLTTDVADGEFITRVLDKDGKPSAMTIDELQKELISNKAFAPIMVGSKATGSGASGSSNGGSSAGNGNSNLSKASPKDLVAHIQAAKAANRS